MFCKFIDSHNILPYNGGILKQKDGGKLVRVVSNPAEQDLREFGYKKLIQTEMPEREGYYYVPRYIDGNTITVEWEEHEMTEEEI